MQEQRWCAASKALIEASKAKPTAYTDELSDNVSGTHSDVVGGL